MKITVHAKKLLDTINKVWSMTGDVRMLAMPEKGALWIEGFGNEVTARQKVEGAEVSGKEKFAFDYNMLKSVLARRAEMTLDYNSKTSRLQFKGKGSKKSGYDGDITTIPLSDVRAVEFDRSKAMKMGKELRAAIAKGLPFVGIKNIYNNEDMVLNFRVSSKGIIIATSDKWHLALYEHMEPMNLKPLEFSLPESAFSKVNTMSDKDYSLSIEDNRVYAFNNDFLVALPLMQTTALPPLDVTIKVAHSIPSNPDAQFTCDREELDAALNNLNAVYEENAPGVISMTEKKHVAVSMSTNNGNVRGTMKASAKWKKPKDRFNISPDLVLDVLGVIKTKEVTVSIAKDKMLYFRVKVDDKATALYTAALL